MVVSYVMKHQKMYLVVDVEESEICESFEKPKTTTH